MLDLHVDPDAKIESEDALEEFIVHKIVRDVQIPRLSNEDLHIFETVCKDVFFGTP